MRAPAGLKQLTVVSRAGNLVVQEEGRLALELELGDVARLAQPHVQSGRWRCKQGTTLDAHFSYPTVFLTLTAVA